MSSPSSSASSLSACSLHCSARLCILQNVEVGFSFKDASRSALDYHERQSEAQTNPHGAESSSEFSSIRNWPQEVMAAKFTSDRDTHVSCPVRAWLVCLTHDNTEHITRTGIEGGALVYHPICKPLCEWHDDCVPMQHRPLLLIGIYATQQCLWPAWKSGKFVSSHFVHQLKTFRRSY